MFKLTIVVLVSMVMLTHGLPLNKVIAGNVEKVEDPKQEDQPKEQPEATGNQIVLTTFRSLIFLS